MTGPIFDEGFCTQFEALLAWRRDIREFKPDPLPDDCFERLVRYARFAPSVGLSEPWRFVRVDDPARRAAMRANFALTNAEALSRYDDDRAALYARLKLQGMATAPVQFAVLADCATAQGHGLGRMTMPETAAYSAIAAIQTLWLVARSWGLGLGWISILDPIAAKSCLDVPDDWTFLGYFCLGYPDHEDDTPVLQREGWEHRHHEVVHYR
jgi:5,6-dimethylbenzimidazole synthase